MHAFPMHFTSLWSDAAATGKMGHLWRSYGFALYNGFSLEGRDRTGSSHSWNWGGGCLVQAELPMMAAVRFMNITHTRAHTQGMTDTGPCQTPPASSTPVQIHIETNIFNQFLIHKLLMAMHIFLFFILPIIKPVTII